MQVRQAKKKKKILTLLHFTLGRRKETGKESTNYVLCQSTLHKVTSPCLRGIRSSDSKSENPAVFTGGVDI